MLKKKFSVQSVCKSPELQFQCDDSSACVAIYDKCNGIVECPDGSDELSCPSKINRRNETKSSSSLSHDHKQSELDDISLSKLQSTENHQPLERFYSNQQSLSGSSSSSSSTTQGTTSSAFIDLHDLPTEPMIFSSQQKSHNDREPILGSHSIKLDHQKQLFDIDDRETPSFLFDIHGKNNENNNNNDNPEVLFSSNDNPWRYPKDFLHETSRSDGPTHLLSRQQIYPPESRPLTPEIMKSYDETVYKPRLYRMPNEIDYSPHSRRNGLAFIPYHHYDHFMQKSNPDDSPIFHRYNSFSRKQRPEVILDPSVIEDMEFYNKLGETSESSKKYPLFHEPKRIHHGSEYEYTHQESNIPKNRQQPSTMANLHITTTDSSQSIIAAVKQSQSEGHTSALLLAFSLGLICCFIGLLIAEWRRRQKLHLWSKSSYRSRPEQAIVFGGRTKISMSRLKPYRRIKKGSGIHGQISKNSTTIHPNTENADEEKALFDDLVL
ncbi:unnamed protein product [Heterobilharzia americana]|nr:unnamed protein product [Heterobilharzia americana]